MPAHLVLDRLHAIDDAVERLHARGGMGAMLEAAWDGIGNWLG
ncbi:hypothetical protein [Streptomyces sp. NPDC018059]